MGYFQRPRCSASLQIRSSLFSLTGDGSTGSLFRCVSGAPPLPEQGPFAAGLLHLSASVAALVGGTARSACVCASRAESLSRLASVRPEPGRRHTSRTRLYVTANLSRRARACICAATTTPGSRPSTPRATVPSPCLISRPATTRSRPGLVPRSTSPSLPAPSRKPRSIWPPALQASHFCRDPPRFHFQHWTYPNSPSLTPPRHNATLAAAPADETIGDEPSTPEAARETSELGLAGPSVNGLSPTANSTLLDGLSTTQNFHSSPRGSGGSPRTSATFGESATRSFQLQPRSFSAQNGSAGGLIAVTSRGQATRLHGTAFALTRQSVFAATNPFSVVTRYNNGAITSQLLKPSDSLVQAGAAAGFPLSPLPYLWLQHTSLFLSLEGQIRSSQVVSTPATASFYTLTPEQLALLANRGVTASAANSALNFLDSLTGAQPRDASRLLSFARLDLVPAVKQQLTLGYIGNRFNSPTGSSSGASAAVVPRGRASLAASILHVDALTGRWLYRLSPLAANELRGQFARDLEYRDPAHAAPAGARDQRRGLRSAGLYCAQRLQLWHTFEHRPHRLPRRTPPPTRRHLHPRARSPSLLVRRRLESHHRPHRRRHQRRGHLPLRQRHHQRPRRRPRRLDHRLHL